MVLSPVATALCGSPYSMPDKADDDPELQDLAERVEGFEARSAAAASALASSLPERYRRASRAREIFESNAIEGKLATLRETYETLANRELWSPENALAEFTMRTALNEEPKIRDVIGLNAARALIEDYMLDSTRQIREPDLRAMHALILDGERDAGSYRSHDVKIVGSNHLPSPHFRVPEYMRELTDWLGASSVAPVWRAAAAHAWLAHIHPFRDGNGRMARLLANYILGSATHVPLIVKSSADRGRYIAALAHSDTAGDIVPLVRVFARAIGRQLREMEQPNFAMTLFEQDVESRADSDYARWKRDFDAFLLEVATKLRTENIALETVGSVAPSDFSLLRDLNKAGNSWLAKVRGPAGSEILLWIGFPTIEQRRYLQRDQIYPSVFLAERVSDQAARHPYTPEVKGRPARWDEISIFPDEHRALVRRGIRGRFVRLEDAADLWSALVAESL
jgi:Fic family protein